MMRLIDFLINNHRVMLSFLFTSLLTWHLINMYFLARKEKTPKWVEKALYNSRHTTRKNSEETPISSTFIMAIVCFGVMLAPGLIMYQISKFITFTTHPVNHLYNQISPMQYYGKNPMLWGTAFISTIYFTIFIFKNISKRGDYYQNLYKKEQEDDLKESHGVIGWATEDELNKALKK